MPNNKNRKKIYSKRKEPILRVKEKPKNPMQFITVFFEKENIWSEFIDKVIFGDMELELPRHQNLKYLFETINNRQLEKDLLKILMNTPNYNPFIDEIPLEVFPNNFKTYIAKKQDAMLKKEQEAEEVDKNIRKISLQGNTYQLCIIQNSTKSINKELFAKGIDIVILFNQQRYIFSSRPKMEHRPDFTKMYEKLQSYEPDTWYLHGSKGILMVREGKYSKISSKQLMLIFQQSFK